MPELPEVETVRMALERVLTGARIETVRTGTRKMRYPFPEHVEERLRGQFIRYVGRRGKYLRLELENGTILVIHLGMSGFIRLVPAGEKISPQKHDHFMMSFDNGVSMVLNDARRFGFVLLFDSAGAFEEFPTFAQMGPEPLGNDFSSRWLTDSLSVRKSPVKTALLDQSLVAGLGNIYVCESLFYAGIDPRRPANSLKEDEITALARAIRDVLVKAIEAGGSSLRDYKHTDETLGYFQHHFAVYDKEGLGCKNCDCGPGKTGGVQRIVQGGRSTFFCSRRQK